MSIQPSKVEDGLTAEDRLAIQADPRLSKLAAGYNRTLRAQHERLDRLRARVGADGAEIAAFQRRMQDPQHLAAFFREVRRIRPDLADSIVRRVLAHPRVLVQFALRNPAIWRRAIRALDREGLQ